MNSCANFGSTNPDVSIYYIGRSKEELQNKNLPCADSVELVDDEELRKEFPNGLLHGYNLYKVIR